MSLHKDDVLEHVLNFGIKSAAQKYSISEAEVLVIAREFKKDIEDDLCSCERANLKGGVSMCFFCDRGSQRLKV